MLATSGLGATLLRVLLILAVAFGVYRFFFASTSPARNVVFVTRELGIAGEVTGVNKARGFKIYLNNSDTPYNFDAFVNAQLLPDSGLGYYLEQGDHVQKAPGAEVLLVTRNGQRSTWTLEAPAPQR